jgi:hypothetical protein
MLKNMLAQSRKAFVEIRPSPTSRVGSTHCVILILDVRIKLLICIYMNMWLELDNLWLQLASVTQLVKALHRNRTGPQIWFLPGTCSCIFRSCFRLRLTNVYKFPLDNFHQQDSESSEMPTKYRNCCHIYTRYNKYFLNFKIKHFLLVCSQTHAVLIILNENLLGMY